MPSDVQIRLSRLISYWLRHDPADGGFGLDERGWARLDDLIGGLAARGHAVTVEDLVQLNAATDKVRWTIDVNGGRIRATHGHSVPIMPDQPSAPPATLFHGTSRRALVQVEQVGLRPMGRQYVHLSEDAEAARVVGARHGEPVVLRVDAGALASAGWLFFEAGGGVWLTAAIPWKYLSV